MSSHSLRLVGKVMVAALVIAACDKQFTSIRVTLSPSTITLAPGESGFVTAEVTASGPDDEWALSAAPPSGISVQFGQGTTIAQTGYTAQASVSVAPGTPPVRTRWSSRHGRWNPGGMPRPDSR